MRDFGFWVRVVAITQLFSLVLANYGEGWLASDNPILNVRKAPPPPAAALPPPPVMDQAKFWSGKPSDFGGAANDADDLAADGWGGGEPDSAGTGSDAEEADNSDSWSGDSEPPEESGWGSSPAPSV